MRTPNVDKPVTIPDLAAMWGKEPRTVRRWLVKANRKCGGALLFRETERGVWKTTIGRLRRLVPEMVDAGPGDANEVEQLRGRVRALELKLNAMAAKQRELIAKVAGL